MSRSSLGRRALLLGGVAGLVGVGVGLGHAAPSGDANQRRLDNRLALWSTFASKSHNLLARYSSTRTSPLLLDELVESGSLAFVEPATLVLRDDGVTGSTTRVEPGGITITPNDPSLPQRSLPPRHDAPALRWLADHLVASFAPGEGADLTAGARVEVSRRGTPWLRLMPPRDSVARGLIRSVTLTLDQGGGAVVRVEIAESDGSTFVLRISDHRQNVEDEMLARVLGSS